MSLSCVNGCKVCDGCMSCQEDTEINMHCPMCGHALDFDDIVYRLREDDEITGCEHCTESVFAEEMKEEL